MRERISFERELQDLGLGMSPGSERLQEVKAKPVYDRQAALDYARKYWNVVCNDNFIAGTFGNKAFKKVPSGTKFEHEFDENKNSLGREHALLPDGSRIEWKNLDDCTHFISCCIGQPPNEKAGGLPITYKQLGSPPNAPFGIVRVSTMVWYLKKKKFVKVLGEKVTDKKIISRLDPGDLIVYFNSKKERYTHQAMYLGDDKIACHTYCRSDLPECTWDNDWNLGEGQGFSWTFLKFIV